MMQCEEILVNILTYNSNLNSLLVSKTFYRLSIISMEFDPQIIYYSCKTNNLKIINYYFDGLIKLNNRINYERCLCLSIKHLNFQSCLVFLDIVELNQNILDICLYTNREIAKLIFERLLTNKYLRRKCSLTVKKLAIKTCSHLSVIKPLYPFKQYIMLLTNELTQDEFKKIINKIDLDPVNKKFIIEVRNRNIQYINNYKHAIIQFENFINEDVYISCMRYFEFINDYELRNSLNTKEYSKRLNKKVIKDRIKVDLQVKTRMTSKYFTKCTKYHSEKCMFEMLKYVKLDEDDYIISLNKYNWFINYILEKHNKELFLRTAEKQYIKIYATLMLYYQNQTL
jgi:hypothetical protein